MKRSAALPTRAPLLHGRRRRPVGLDNAAQDDCSRTPWVTQRACRRQVNRAGPRAQPIHASTGHAGAAAPYMCCVRLCAVDDGRCAFPLLRGISGDEAQNIIDPPAIDARVLSHPRCGGTQRRGSGRSKAPSSGGDSLTRRGFRPDLVRSRRLPGRGCLAWVSATRPTHRPPQLVPIMCCSSTSDLALSRENTDPEAPNST